MKKSTLLIITSASLVATSMSFAKDILPFAQSHNKLSSCMSYVSGRPDTHWNKATAKGATVPAFNGPDSPNPYATFTWSTKCPKPVISPWDYRPVYYSKYGTLNVKTKSGKPIPLYCTDSRVGVKNPFGKWTYNPSTSTYTCTNQWS